MTTQPTPLCYVCNNPVHDWQASVTAHAFPLGVDGDMVTTVRHANPADHLPTKEPTNK